MKNYYNKIDLIKDINISSVTFSIDGKDIIFEFLDMFNGKLAFSLKCKQVYVFNYCNNFDDDEGFACYVGEISVVKLSKNNIENQLINLGYNFIDLDGRTVIPESNDFCSINIIGGELLISVICIEYELKSY